MKPSRLFFALLAAGVVLVAAETAHAQFVRPLPVGGRLPGWPVYPGPRPPWQNWHWHWNPWPVYPVYPIPVPYAVPTPVYIPVDMSSPKKEPDPKSSLVLPQNKAIIEVKLPTPDAELWLDGEKIDERGTVRRFLTPELYPARVYHSRLAASWVIDNKLHNRTIPIDVKMGDILRVDFTQPK